ncbi:UTRA domain-containing protein [Streptomyces thermolineatus]|uniref:UTRA domain-containing protein n=1 Tax=Streptomyces thermolineatus TaxID=44033 RepID=A0ABN3MVJ3_9ACTN
MDAPYRRLAADLRARITAGEWQPGDRLPSHRELREEYDVGRGVVEHAMALLRQRGVVEGIRRARLTVAYPPAVRTLTDPDAEWPYGRGDAAAGSCRASEDLAARLQVLPRARLYWRRQELLDPGGQPAMLLTTWQRSVSSRPHANFRCEVRPHVLTADEAELLGLVAGGPAFVVERTRYSAAGRPVQTADLVLPADRWRLGW